MARQAADRNTTLPLASVVGGTMGMLTGLFLDQFVLGLVIGGAIGTATGAVLTVLGLVPDDRRAVVSTSVLTLVAAGIVLLLAAVLA